MTKLKRIIAHPGLLLGIYLALAAFTAAQQYFNTRQAGEQYTRYNNYVIFKQSHFHLIEGKDLYKEYPGEHWDFFKYTPSFAFLFGILAYLPDLAGIILWNLVNVILLYIGVRKLPELSDRTKAFILLYVLIEMTTSLQNTQSNVLLSGLVIMVFNLLERNRYLPGTLLLVLSVYLKLFGVFTLILFIFYPGKWKLALYTLMWSVIVFFIPLLAVNFSYLISQYEQWIDLLVNDQSKYLGYSVMGWLNSWFSIDVPKKFVVGAGLVLLCLPLIRYRNFGVYRFRLMMLASILVWVVIFNHMAESPTFIIAMAGVSIWYFSQRMTVINLILLSLAFVFTSLSPTDLVPDSLWESIIEPYVLKGVPCILVWMKIELEMLFDRW